jgi:hypothetical protein
MGSGTSESKDCDFSWRGKKTSKGTCVITTKSTLLRSISRRVNTFEHEDEHEHEDEKSAPNPILHYSTTPVLRSFLLLSFITPSLHFSRFKARHDQY